MATQPDEIGAFEAKTRFSELLRATERGRSFTIVRHGRPVARLVPFEAPTQAALADTLAAFHAIRARAGEPLHLKSLVEEGRRR